MINVTRATSAAESGRHHHCEKTFTLKEKNEEEIRWRAVEQSLDMKRRCVFRSYSVLQRQPSQLVIQSYTDNNTHAIIWHEANNWVKVTSVKVSDSPKWLLFPIWRVSWSRNTCSTCSSAPAAEEHWSGSTERFYTDSDCLDAASQSERSKSSCHSCQK